jgi:hypothetical protein
MKLGRCSPVRDLAVAVVNAAASEITTSEITAAIVKEVVAAGFDADRNTVQSALKRAALSGEIVRVGSAKWRPNGECPDAD